MTTSTSASTSASTRRSTRSLKLIVAALLIGLFASMATVAAPAADAAPVKRHTVSASSIQKSVLNLINKQRRAHHLPKVKANKKLRAAALRHNRQMAGKNQMSHQLRGESSLGRRIDKAGYNWGAVAENIAWNSDISRNGVLLVQKLMYNERAPYDGHRRNILNRSYKEVGVSVYVDKKHNKIWLTTDFGRKR